MALQSRRALPLAVGSFFVGVLFDAMLPKADGGGGSTKTLISCREVTCDRRRIVALVDEMPSCRPYYVIERMSGGPRQDLRGTDKKSQCFIGTYLEAVSLPGHNTTSACSQQRARR